MFLTFFIHFQSRFTSISNFSEKIFSLFELLIHPIHVTNIPFLFQLYLQEGDTTMHSTNLQRATDANVNFNINLNSYPLSTIGQINQEPHNLDNIISFPNVSAPITSITPTTTAIKSKFFPHPSHPKSPQQRVSPIRDNEKVTQIYKSLLSSGKHSLRNATIFALQLAIGRRTNDILKLKLSDIFDFYTTGENKGQIKSVKSKITVDEHKTGKTARDIPIPQREREMLLNYSTTLKKKNPDSLLFPSQKRNRDGSQRPLSTSSLDNIYQEYTSCIFEEDDEQTHISSYAARKTYGYNIYKKCLKEHSGLIPGTDISALQYVQSMFNHRDAMTTLRYIGAYDDYAEELAENIAGQYEF